MKPITVTVYNQDGNQTTYVWNTQKKDHLDIPSESARLSKKTGGSGRAVADDWMGVRLDDVEDRRTVDGDAELEKFGGDKVGVEARRLDRPVAVVPGDLGEAPGRRRGAPVGRPQPGDAPTFLVDKHGSVGAPHAIAQFGDQVPHLVRVRAIARKKNESQRIGVPEESPLGIAQDRPAAAQDGGTGAVPGGLILRGGQPGIPLCV